MDTLKDFRQGDDTFSSGRSAGKPDAMNTATG